MPMFVKLEVTSAYEVKAKNINKLGDCIAFGCIVFRKTF
jgi:hypothetical protein